MKNFDRDFNKNITRMKRTFWAVFAINGLISLVVLVGTFWVVYVLLKYFGIVG